MGPQEIIFKVQLGWSGERGECVAWEFPGG